MESLQYHLDMARYNWKQRVSGNRFLEQQWEDISYGLFSDGVNGRDAFLQFVAQYQAYDALSLLIDLRDGEIIDFVTRAPTYGREIASMTMVKIATQAPVGHLLQLLLVAGALDRLLLMGFQGVDTQSLPDWARERLFSILTSTTNVNGGSYRFANNRLNSFADEYAEREVWVSGFEIGVYPITQVIYQTIMRTNPSTFLGSTKPVETVSWLDAIRFCNALSEITGREPAYSIGSQPGDIQWDYNANGFRLPTEVEWEISCRAEGEFTYSGSDTISEVGWTAKDKLDSTRCVGMRKPNQWRLFDMSGLVFEWVWDWFDAYPEELEDNHQGPFQGHRKVRRGGSWMSAVRASEVSYRSDRDPSYIHENTGFRVVFTTD